MNVLILGSSGLVGSYAYRYLKNKNVKVIGVSRSISKTTDVLADARNFEEIEKVINNFNPSVLINAIKFSGSPDDCEINREECELLNFKLVEFLAKIQHQYNFLLLQISTDWVYEGKRGVIYKEDSPPNPQNFYALTKYKAEIASQQAKRFLILRPTGIFGFEDRPRNFLARLLDAGKNNKIFEAPHDQFSQPISALELAKIIYELIDKKIENRIFLTVGKDYLSRYEAALIICDVFGIDKSLIKKSSSKDRKVKIPQYLKCDTSNIESVLGRKMKSFKEMLLELREFEQLL